VHRSGRPASFGNTVRLGENPPGAKQKRRKKTENPGRGTPCRPPDRSPRRSYSSDSRRLEAAGRNGTARTPTFSPSGRPRLQPRRRSARQVGPGEWNRKPSGRVTLLRLVRARSQRTESRSGLPIKAATDARAASPSPRTSVTTFGITKRRRRRSTRFRARTMACRSRLDQARIGSQKRRRPTHAHRSVAPCCQAGELGGVTFVFAKATIERPGEDDPLPRVGQADGDHTRRAQFGRTNATPTPLSSRRLLVRRPRDSAKPHSVGEISDARRKLTTAKPLLAPLHRRIVDRGAVYRGGVTRRSSRTSPRKHHDERTPPGFALQGYDGDVVRSFRPSVVQSRSDGPRTESVFTRGHIVHEPPRRTRQSFK